MRLRALFSWQLVLLLVVAMALPGGSPSQAAYVSLGGPSAQSQESEKTPPLSGIYDFKDVNFSTGLTECPQAGFPPEQPKPLDLRDQDRVEQLSQGGNDRRANPEFSCFPQNETSIAVNPLNQRNLVGGANDYRLGWGTSGFYASTNGGSQWYSGIVPFPSLPSGDNLDGGGDPALVFDRSGVVYYIDINFNRTDDTNGIFARRSTNGGFTWSRPRVLSSTSTASLDGAVTFIQDNDTLANSSVPFNDKEYVAAGPRPAGVAPVCFTRTGAPAASCAAGVIGVDRLYVTWSLFTGTTVKIMFSFSDDQARSWSAPRAISGSAAFCVGGVVANECDTNQYSIPTVSPVTGHLYVAFENFNTPDENQYVVVRSKDGGATFQGPFFVTPVFDQNYPVSGASGRNDCRLRGQQGGRRVLTNSCFRLNTAGNIVVDKRAGAFADDLYLVMSDNRNGTRLSTNTDVFLFKSTDGGSSWVGPTRVNDDASLLTVDRTCGTTTPGCAGRFGNDQWFPWADISERGDLNVVFYDRRLDEDSVAHEWPTSRQRPGNYLTWLWGAQCSVTTADSRDCVAPEAALIPQPTAPIDPGSGAQPGGAQAAFPLRNFTIADVPSNMDYAFSNGVFIGDYNNVAIGPDNQAWAFWTDARNGRSSRAQVAPRRNPICEQADVFVDGYSAQSGGAARKPAHTDELFLVAPCPTQAIEQHGNE